jgi:(+)-pinoresinol hydroxylase
MRLPPGITKQSFVSVLAEWRRIVGGEWVLVNDDDLDTYRDAYSPFWGEGEERVASAAVCPSSVEEVQAVMRAANRNKVAIYPISTGKNLTYGGSAPAYSGSVVLDLKRMNRILEVSEKNACALVEPGVSYFDLYRYIRENKLKLWIDCPDPGWGSPIGNSLDHGAGYTSVPYRDHFDAHCGMEIVLASGEVMRTGMGALPHAKTWQQFKYGMGPLVDGLFSQSNFGVVTKMGFWLMPQPECALVLTATSQHYEDGAAFIDTLIALIYADMITSQTQIISPILHGPADAELSALAHAWDAGRGAALNDYASRKGLPFWTAPFVLYGPEEVVRAKAAHITKKFQTIPGARVTEEAFLRFPLTDDQVLHVVDKARIGVPSLAFFASRRAPNVAPLEGHVDFSPIVPMDGASIIEAMNTITQSCQEMNITPLGGMPLFYHTRTACLIYAIPVGRDAAANKRVRDAFGRLMDLGARHGWGEYRIHPAFMDKAAGLYNFNDHALLHFQERIKDAVDPNGILSAGRYGIWPKHLRGAIR